MKAPTYGDYGKLSESNLGEIFDLVDQKVMGYGLLELWIMGESTVFAFDCSKGPATSRCASSVQKKEK